MNIVPATSIVVEPKKVLYRARVAPTLVFSTISTNEPVGYSSGFPFNHDARTKRHSTVRIHTRTCELRNPWIVQELYNPRIVCAKHGSML